MHKSLVRIIAAAIALSTALLTAPTAFAQGITTSAITGIVKNASGEPIAGATVTAVHEPSGTRATTTSRANGQYDMSGLRVGGPYTITATSGDLKPDVRNEVYLELGQTTTVDVTMRAEIVQLQSFTVVADRDTTFGTGRMGAGSNFTDEDMANAASVRNNVQDIARLDSRLTLNSLDQGGNLSAQGQNFRFNSFLVDGVESNDPFGLNGNGFSSLRSPIPMNALQALSVELNPYDVRRAGFTGALLNAITKSGSNQFHGNIKYEFSNQSLRGENPNPASATYRMSEPYTERTYNIGVSGPIIKNKLFFMLNFDDFRREATPPPTQFKYQDASGVTAQSLIDRVIARAKALGYDPGALNVYGAAVSTEKTNISTQKTYIGKLDWNISDSHRLALTYRRNDGTQPSFAGFTTVFGQSFSNYWFQQPRITNAYTAQMFSQWTPDLRTEATYTYTKYNGSPANNGSPFPAVSIQGFTGIRGDTGATITTGSVNLGTEFSRQLNILNTKENQFKLTGEYSLGSHTIAAGGDIDILKYYNAFLQGYYGSYTFRNVADWEAGAPFSYSAAIVPSGDINDAIANWKYSAYGALVQDTWKPSEKLTVLAGLRLDYPYIKERPIYNAAFDAGFGIRNDTNNSGNYTLAPRIGFNYKLDTKRRTEIRGGYGLFQGRNPAVWLSNAYSNVGRVYTITQSVSGTATLGNGFFVSDVTKQPIPAGSAPVQTINVTDPNFKQPVIWKGNLAIEHQLPFDGWNGLIEVNFTDTERALAVQFLNYTELGTLPDGRLRYGGVISPSGTWAVSGITSLAQAQSTFGTTTSITNTTSQTVGTVQNASSFSTTAGTISFVSTNTNGRRRVNGFGDVYRLTNTKKGDSAGVTFALNRPMKNRWAASIAWTRSSATEVSPMTSSTAGSLYNTRAVFNPNEDVASTSNTSTTDKIVLTLRREFEFVKRYKTTVSAIYQGQSGRPYSWVFKGDANGDGFSDNDIFYVPLRGGDPKVRWASTAERDAFYTFADANGLAKFEGQAVPRNSVKNPWQNTVDLSITQDIPVTGKVKTQFFVQFVNIANLFNKKWGIIDEMPFSYKRRAAGATYDSVNNQWVYTFNANTYDTIPVVADDTPISRWQAKIGVNVTF